MNRRNPKAYVLLSGGVDSTTCLYLAANQFGRDNTVGVSVNYKQRHSKEVMYAADSCKALGIRHIVKDVARIIPDTMLTNEKRQVPDVSYDDIEGVSPTYVPFRNGLLLSTVVSQAHGDRVLAEESQDAGEVSLDSWAVFFGAHAEDAHNWAYPDCTPEFIGAMANAIFIGSYQQVRLHTPFMWQIKAQIIRFGSLIGVDYSRTWSCYKGGDLHCGVCPTCRARKSAFISAGVEDPTRYEK